VKNRVTNIDRARGSGMPSEGRGRNTGGLTPNRSPGFEMPSEGRGGNTGGLTPNRSPGFGMPREGRGGNSSAGHLFADLQTATTGTGRCGSGAGTSAVATRHAGRGRSSPLPGDCGRSPNATINGSLPLRVVHAVPRCLLETLLSRDYDSHLLRVQVKLS
jgi:hypothetical protein